MSLPIDIVAAQKKRKRETDNTTKHDESAQQRGYHPDGGKSYDWIRLPNN